MDHFLYIGICLFAATVKCPVIKTTTSSVYLCTSSKPHLSLSLSSLRKIEDISVSHLPCDVQMSSQLAYTSSSLSFLSTTGNVTLSHPPSDVVSTQINSKLASMPPQDSSVSSLPLTTIPVEPNESGRNPTSITIYVVVAAVLVSFVISVTMIIIFLAIMFIRKKKERRENPEQAELCLLQCMYVQMFVRFPYCKYYFSTASINTMSEGNEQCALKVPVISESRGTCYDMIEMDNNLSLNAIYCTAVDELHSSGSEITSNAVQYIDRSQVVEGSNFLQAPFVNLNSRYHAPEYAAAASYDDVAPSEHSVRYLIELQYYVSQAKLNCLNSNFYTPFKRFLKNISGYNLQDIMFLTRYILYASVR